MKAYLATYVAESIKYADLIVVPDNYDGDPYGDCVPFAVGSNQIIVTEDNGLWKKCVEVASDNDTPNDQA